MQAGVSMDVLIRQLVVVFAWVWGAIEVLQQVKQRKQRRGGSDYDKGSLVLLYLAIALGYSLGIPFAFSKFGRVEWGSPYVALSGILLIVGGLCIRIIAMRTLGGHFTYVVGIQRQHELISKGMYRYVRHPGYLGQLIIFLGIGMAFTNWLSLLSLLIPIVIAFGWRIRVEERALLDHFASNYAEYQKRTWRLIPWTY